MVIRMQMSNLRADPGRELNSLGDTPRRLTVLLVEDEWLVRMEMADSLADTGWTVVEAGSGEEAIALITGTAPDLLITDIRLSGGLTGWDVADAFRTAYPGRPILFASASPCIHARMDAHSAFLGKPLRTDQLVESCRRLVGA